MLLVLTGGCSGHRVTPLHPSFLERNWDLTLQLGLDNIIAEPNLNILAREQRLGIAVVDISNPDEPRFAGINPFNMMYAASMSKLGILFGLFKRIEAGTLVWNQENQELAKLMIQESSNPAATALFYRVGPKYISQLLQSPKYQLYQPRLGGGLWIGKEYGKGPAWQRDPLMDLSHAATPYAVARFYHLLETNRLVSPRWSNEMKASMAYSTLNHKFIKGLSRCLTHANIYRKSGSWRTFHSDSVLVDLGPKKYVAVAMVNDEQGQQILEHLIISINALIVDNEFISQEADT